MSDVVFVGLSSSCDTECWRGQSCKRVTNPNEIAKMAQDHIWDIRRRVVHGREMYLWAVIECASGKTVMSGEELLHSSALKSAMKATRQLETQNKVPRG